MQRIMTVLLVLLLCCYAARAGQPVLDQTVEVQVWGGSLTDALRIITDQTGGNIVYYQPDFADIAPGSLFLTTGRVTVRTVLEALARRYSFRYQVSAAGRVAISRSYDWAGTQPALQFTPIPAALAQKTDKEELGAFVREFLKPLSMLQNTDFSWSLEKSPTPENAAGLQFVAALPPVLGQYMQTVFAGMDARAGRPAQATHARAWSHPSQPQALLATQIRPPAAGNLRDVLTDIAGQTQTAILTAALPPSLPTRIEAPLADTTLGSVSASLAKSLSLGGRTLCTAGALLFWPGAADTLETDTRCREFFWDGLSAECLDISRKAASAGGPEGIIRTIRTQIHPQVWLDPMCTLASLPSDGRVVLLAPANVIDDVRRFVEQLP